MPAIRPVRALGSLQLVGHANNPSKVITELAYITDERLNSPERSHDSDVIDLEAPLDVSFEEFMNGVNSRGKNTKARQRKLTVEQADAILLGMVQRGDVDLIASQDDPCAIETIRVLPEAKKKLAGFLPKLRGYGDIPYDQEYRGTIALAKRHFSPSGRAPTKRELTTMLFEAYQQRRDLRLRLQASVQRPATRTLSIQTSLAKIERGVPLDAGAVGEVEGDQAADPGSSVVPEMVYRPSSPANEVPQNNDVDVDMELHSAVPPANQSPDADCDDEMPSQAEPERERAVPVLPCTPAPTRINPYMTPVSNPRRGDHAMAVPPDSSPTRSTSAAPMLVPDLEDDIEPGVREELVQAMATSHGKLAFYYARYEAESKKANVLEKEKNKVERKLERVERALRKTELKLRESDTKRSMLARIAKPMFDHLDWIWGQFSGIGGFLDAWRELATAITDDTNDMDDIDDPEEWVVHDAGL